MESYLLVISLAIVGYIFHNSTITVSAGILLILKILLSEEKLNYFGTHGMTWGVILLTAAMLTPLGTGAIKLKDIVNILKSPEGILSLLVGGLVAILGKWGVETLSREPQIVVSILIGTIVGVIFFKGIPMGPLIASGIFYALMKILALIIH